MAFVAGVSAASVPEAQQQPTLLTGADWKAYGSREKQAYLNGFLSGAAAEQVAAAMAQGAPVDSAAVSSSAIAKVKAEKRLHFPYSASVYTVQIDDFYWWTDHLGTPVADVMISVNRQMLHP